MGPNGVHGEPKKCPREPKKDPGGASAAPKGASKGSRGSPRGVPGTPNGALGSPRAGIFTDFGKVGEFFDAKNAKKKNGRSLVYIDKVFLLILLKSLGFDAEKHFKTKWR